MKEKPLKCYVIMIAKHFPGTHPRKGQETNFKELIFQGIANQANYAFAPYFEKFKLHTMRKNYPLWQKRIAEVQAGEAYLSLREWEGRPYWSDQIEIFKLTKADGVGIEKIYFEKSDIAPMVCSLNDGLWESIFDVAKNDGLYFLDFVSWFFPIPKEPLAIIHFTPFRYL